MIRTDPTMMCKTCGRERNCTLHRQADFPPDAARKWLRKTCADKTTCDLVYTAGLALGGRPRAPIPKPDEEGAT